MYGPERDVPAAKRRVKISPQPVFSGKKTGYPAHTPARAQSRRYGLRPVSLKKEKQLRSHLRI
jgi:hypothetical protein